jgi:hypothetical protein
MWALKSDPSGLEGQPSEPYEIGIEEQSFKIRHPKHENKQAGKRTSLFDSYIRIPDLSNR